MTTMNSFSGLAKLVKRCGTLNKNVGPKKPELKKDEQPRNNFEGRNLKLSELVSFSPKTVDVPEYPEIIDIDGESNKTNGTDNANNTIGSAKDLKNSGTTPSFFNSDDYTMGTVDGSMHVKTERDENGNKTFRDTTEYDKAGNVTAKTAAKYDENGNVSIAHKQYYGKDGQVEKEYQWTYYENGKKKSETVKEYLGNNKVQITTVKFDKNGNQVSSESYTVPKGGTRDPQLGISRSISGSGIGLNQLSDGTQDKTNGTDNANNTIGSAKDLKNSGTTPSFNSDDYTMGTVDGSMHVKTERDENGNKTFRDTTEYDKAGNVTAKTAAKYDENGNVSIAHKQYYGKDGQVEKEYQWTYYENGKKKSETVKEYLGNNKVQITTVKFDKNGNQVSSESYTVPKGGTRDPQLGISRNISGSGIGLNQLSDGTNSGATTGNTTIGLNQLSDGTQDKTMSDLISEYKKTGKQPDINTLVKAIKKLGIPVPVLKTALPSILAQLGMTNKLNDILNAFTLQRGK